jgi:hypothetical protein
MTTALPPSDAPRVLGVSLLRNEDRFAAWALANVSAFCDRLLILDNASTDRTRAVIDAAVALHPDARVETVADAYDTHRFVEPYAGSNWWVLGVDGDEIYDPAGLARFKARLGRGAFADAWRVYGHCLHATGIDFARARAAGHPTPPARSVVKLYNFAALEAWRQPGHQRLHGKDMVFRPGFSAGAALRPYLSTPWETADLRLLHLCFLPRSSAEGDAVSARANPSEARRAGSWRGRLAAAVGRLVGRGERPAFKLSHYARGAPVAASIAGFGAPDALGARDPFGAETRAMVERVTAARVAAGELRLDPGR